MANLNETFEKPEFDWSAISVGDYKLDHSQNFFGNKENNSNLGNENRQLIFSNCATPLALKAIMKMEPQIESTPFKNIEPTQDTEQPELAAGPVQQEEQRETKVIKDEIEEAKLAQEASFKVEPTPVTRTSPAFSKQEPTEQQPKQIEEQQRETKVIMEENEIENMPEADKPVARGNLRMQWSPIPHRQHNYEHHDEGAAAAAPKAYAFKDVYECKRQQALRRQEEEDRQARQFHSRPMPNFKALHKRIEDRVVVHRITLPRTPETVKYWQASVERRRHIKEEVEQEPVPPRHKTFNLRSEQRVRDRRDFDSAVQVRQAQKKKEQEEQRKRCEVEEIKEIRKMTVFKARPNPFK